MLIEESTLKVVVWQQITRVSKVSNLSEIGIVLERFFRGFQEKRNLQRSQAIVASFGSSGRTWLRALLSRAFVLEHGLQTNLIIDLDNLNRLCVDVPIVFFTHDNYLRNYTGDGSSKKAFAHKPVLFLARHPGDVAVSQYYQWKYRMRRRKKKINNYPLEPELSLFEFVMSTECGLPKIIRFMNEWADQLDVLPTHLVIRYEDLRTDTAAELERVIAFLGGHVRSTNIIGAISWASIENMRALENQGSPLIDSGRSGKDRSTTNSYKARRAKVQGYRDDFTEDQLDAIDQLISKTLSSVYGYGSFEPLSSIKAG